MNEQYIAGLFDGEGCISIYKRFPKEKEKSLSNRYLLRIELVSTFKPIIFL